MILSLQQTIQAIKMYDLVVCIYACDKIEKYRNQMMNVRGTWGKDVPSNIRILFFVGEGSLSTDEDVVHLSGVSDDYFSASDKQFLGMKYVHDHYPYRFIMVCGADTYPVFTRILRLLEDMNHEEVLYIGGHGCVRRIGNDISQLYFHSGGPGFIVSRAAVEKIYDILGSATRTWYKICDLHGIHLQSACDVAISYFLHKIDGMKIIKHDGFFHCNHKGHPCHVGQIDMDRILSCHNMSLDDFDEFTSYLMISSIKS